MAFEDELASGLRFHRSGELARAEEIYRKVLAKQPDHPDALNLLGMAQHQVGKNDEAMELILRGISLEPERGDFHCNLGTVLIAMGRPQDATTAIRRALAIQPESAWVHFMFANALAVQQKWIEAAAAYRQAIRFKNDFPEAHNNLGNMLRELGQPAQAADAFRQALRLRSDLAAAEFNLAVILADLGKTTESIEIYGRLAARFPGDYLANNGLGQVLTREGNMDEAEAALRQALRSRPQSPDALNNLATVLKETGRLEEALDCLRRAVEIAPNFLVGYSNYLLMIHYSQNFDGPKILEEMKKWNERHAQPLAGSMPRPVVDYKNDRKLRIGYVSPDFCDHVVGRNFLPLFRELDRDEFEVYAFSDVYREDATTAEFRRYSDIWRVSARLTDDALAELIRQDQIDILIDMTGHTHRNRLLAFARGPAPVQATFGGYPGGTGLAAMHYHVTDPYLDPPGMTESHYVEKLVRMPDSFWCYDLQEDGPPVQAPPALQNGFITFGCFNNLGKITDRTLELWSNVLARSSGSKLVMLAPQGSCRNRIVQKLGVEPERIQFLTRMSRREYLSAHARIDLALDSLPYGCHTTGLDCLWMSVPIVTRIGQTACGRAVFSHLSNLHLTELAASTDEEFVELAVALAADLPRLAHLRETIRPRMRASPLTDARRFARNFQNALMEMWRENDHVPKL